MNKHILMFPLLALCGCQPAEEDAQLANPAATYCIEQGGTLAPRKTAEGQTSDCQLPDGRVIEQWEFYKENHSG